MKGLRRLEVSKNERYQSLLMRGKREFKVKKEERM